MATSIDQAFVKQYETEVHLAYQRLGSKLRKTVRNRTDAKGSTVVFQKIGKGTAATKSRHGAVPVMNLDHTPVECQIADYYAGDWIDKLDELKLAHDERRVVIETGAHALGRKTDELIAIALNASANTAGTGADGLTKTKVLAAYEKLGDADIPDDGQRYAVVGWKQWGQLLDIDEFANADYVGTDELPWQGATAKKWLGALWMPISALPKSGNVRNCFWYHKRAVGHACAAEVKSDITWHGDRAAHFVSNMMSQGAALIDSAGVVVMPCLE
jgi:hypothetical protein